MKKILIIVTLLIIVGISAYNAVQNTTTGTTTGTYARAFDEAIFTADYEDMIFFIANTGDSTMYYKVYGYGVNGNTIYEEYVSETSLANSTTTTVKISHTAYASIEIWVKNNSGATTYQVDYTLKP